MNIFDSVIRDINSFKKDKLSTGICTEYPAKGETGWEAAEGNNIILLSDLGVELGHPDLASVSFLTWTDDGSLVDDGKITLIGPDINEAPTSRLPFGKVVICEIEGFDEENAVERNRELHLAKFDLSLKGFMVKSASAYMAEWCRISKESLNKGFSLNNYGEALILELRKNSFVKSVEIIFVTSSVDDVNDLFPMGNRAVKTISAMSKIINEMEHDCEDCEYQDVCEDADELSELRKTHFKDA